MRRISPLHLVVAMVLFSASGAHASDATTAQLVMAANAAATQGGGKASIASLFSTKLRHPRSDGAGCDPYANHFATSDALFDSAHIRFVHLHPADQPIATGAHHGAAELVQPGPGGYIATQTQDPLQLQRAGPAFLRCHPPSRPEPQRQGLAGVLENRARRHRGLVTAVGAEQQIAFAGP